MAEKPNWISSGAWSWKSFPTEDLGADGKTVLRVAAVARAGEFQSLIELSWADYTQEDAEQLADYVCCRMNGQH